MNFIYESERLIIKVLDKNYAPMVLDFLSENRDIFEPYEAEKPPNYYTAKYQSVTLRLEYNSFLKGNYARFYVFTKEEPDKIIGTVSFGHMHKFPFFSTSIGYKFSKTAFGNGYATEAVSCTASAIFKDAGFHRIEAYVLPDNTASIKLLKRVGFEYEGIARSSICVRGDYKDHLQFSLINPSNHNE